MTDVVPNCYQDLQDPKRPKQKLTSIEIWMWLTFWIHRGNRFSVCLCWKAYKQFRSQTKTPKSILYNIFKDFIFQFPEDQNELHRINYLLDFCFNCCSLLSTNFKEREGKLKSLTSYLPLSTSWGYFIRYSTRCYK